MKIIKTPLPGLLIIEPGVFEDHRGYFFESFHQQRYVESGIDAQFIQDNESKSGRGVVRGLHYQLNPVAQAKLVRVIVGVVYDVALDLRNGSPTFGQWFGLELNETDKKQLFVPRGFAHGFSVLSETAVFSYKCDNMYSREYERAINPFDPKLAIDWQLNESELKVSDKDKVAPLFADADMNFVF
jgi:dTDP-4-dehydrorhamnose 3,5-epimerase